MTTENSLTADGALRGKRSRRAGERLADGLGEGHGVAGSHEPAAVLVDELRDRRDARRDDRASEGQRLHDDDGQPFGEARQQQGSAFPQDLPDLRVGCPPPQDHPILHAVRANGRLDGGPALAVTHQHDAQAGELRRQGGDHLWDEDLPLRRTEPADADEGLAVARAARFDGVELLECDAAAGQMNLGGVLRSSEFGEPLAAMV